MEYIKLFWNHNLPEEPTVILYEVNIENERLAERSIDIFRNGKTQNVSDFYANVVEALLIPTVKTFNEKMYGDEFIACAITKEEFEKVWEA